MSDDDKVKPKVLIADDSRLIRASFAKYLGEEFDIRQCENGEQALALLEQEGDFSLVFTDLSMPRMDGYELLDRIRNHDDPSFHDLPVIVVTGKEDAEQDKERMLGLGATDLINKPFHSSELVSRARGYATLRRKVAKLEQKVPVDTLTGLVTRDYFLAQGDKHVALARRQGFKITIARVAITNLEQLKQDFGVLRVIKMMAIVAKVLRENIRTEDIAASFGTGQFALLLPGAEPQATVQVWARLRHRMANFELKVGEKKACLVFASGISSQRVDESVDGFGQLLQQAEDSLKTASSRPADTVAPEPTVVPAVAETGRENESVDKLLMQLQNNEAPLRQQTLAAMHAVLPLLHLANHQLDLELDDVLNTLVWRLREGGEVHGPAA
jgi:diguanylate cyclase (GGDEF)-like protein